jgi:uncharacterized membrane protein
MFAPHPMPMRFVLAALLLAACTGPALAGLSICNRTSHPARIALGRFNGTDWMSEGWWNVQVSKCETLIKGELKARYYYLYTSDNSAGGWPGAHNFCIGAGEIFQVFGRENCAGRGYDRKSFYEIDTEQKSDYTTYISD